MRPGRRRRLELERVDDLLHSVGLPGGVAGVRDLIHATATDEVYRERAHLLALLARVVGADNAAFTTAPDDPAWWLLGLRVGGRVCTWHVADRDIDLFDHVPHVDPTDRRVRWDGHTTADKYRHLRSAWSALDDDPPGVPRQR